MTRVLLGKQVENIRLANGYGGWIYCEHCGENIGYLCYVTYSRFYFEFKCNCGGTGSLELFFENNQEPKISKNSLQVVKNRLCCPNDKSPLLTIIDKKLETYFYEITCVECNTKYRGGNKGE